MFYLTNRDKTSVLHGPFDSEQEVAEYFSSELASYNPTDYMILKEHGRLRREFTFSVVK